MAHNTEQMRDDEAEFAAAFNEDMAPAAEQTEDEAFGITPEEQAPAVEAEGEAVVEEAAPAEEAVQAAEAVAEEEAPVEQAAPAAEDDEFDPVKERQRLKSWEGRLRKLEEQLKAQSKSTEEDTSEAMQETAAVAQEAGDSELAQAADDMAEQVADGTITPEEAMRQLAEDFGEDFIKLIETVAVAKAREVSERAVTEKVGQLDGTVQEIVGHIKDREQRAHFQKIAEAHPDFMDVAQDDGFKGFINGLPDEFKGEAQRIAERGTADEIIELLNIYKEVQSQQQQPPEEEAPQSQVDEAAVDAAEGVRGGGLKLPDQPKPVADGYEEAWSEF